MAKKNKSKELSATTSTGRSYVMIYVIYTIIFTTILLYINDFNVEQMENMLTQSKQAHMGYIIANSIGKIMLIGAAYAAFNTKRYVGGGKTSEMLVFLSGKPFLVGILTTIVLIIVITAGESYVIKINEQIFMSFILKILLHSLYIIVMSIILAGIVPFVGTSLSSQGEYRLGNAIQDMRQGITSIFPKALIHIWAFGATILLVHSSITLLIGLVPPLEGDTLLSRYVVNQLTIIFINQFITQVMQSAFQGKEVYKNIPRTYDYEGYLDRIAGETPSQVGGFDIDKWFDSDQGYDDTDSYEYYSSYKGCDYDDYDNYDNHEDDYDDYGDNYNKYYYK